LRIILVGFGTVGQSLTRILIKDRDWLVRTHGFDPQVTTIIDSQGSCHDENGLDLARVLEVKSKHGTVQKYQDQHRGAKNGSSRISDTQAEIMIETTPSNFKNGEPGLSNIKEALSSGKHVVTTNKGPLALAMAMLQELAKHRGLQLRFSGTVGGGTPFLNLASKCLAGEKINEIKGILNGTTNYILTRMEEDSLSFQEALREAQKKGYAEKNPENDIEGFDTAAKIVIISNFIMKKRLRLEEVDRTGIAKLTQRSIGRKKNPRTRTKLIGRLTESEAYVRPEAIPVNSPICVRDTLNALTFSTQHAGDLTLIGPGAGGEETASAILRDIVEIRSQYSRLG
jgi:homoserine dehydrogenase